LKKKPAVRVFFQEFSENEIAEVLGLAEIVSYSADSFLFKRGDEANSFYIISGGELEVFSHERGERVTIAIIKSGSVVGEIGFLDGQERSASARAITDLIALKITKDIFATLEKTNIKLAIKLMQEVQSILSDRLRSSNQLLIDYQTVKIDEKFLKKFDITEKQTL
jgi:CRP/FNR family cyclic AMP-dependent transcriptional regulator